jgi:cyclophilin family peptidyl-prolyl cis-trans isomerase
MGGLATVRADLPSPVVEQTLPAQIIARAGSAQAINLGAYIQDPNVPGTAVRMFVQIGNLSSGNIDLALDDAETPQTVANFLAYLNDGYFTNTIIHRSVPGFIIQGGEYYFSSLTQLSYIPTFSAVPNEPGISNVAGTIAMAKVSGNVNSATDQWFINLVDNSSNLDNQDGGFTAFGQILGNGLDVANAIAAVPTYNGTSIAADWTNIPLTSTTIGNSNGFLISSFVTISMAVIPPVTYTVSSGNTSLVTASVSGNSLTLTPSATNLGITNITVTATDTEGSQLQTSFSVSVLDTYSLWAATQNFGNSTLAAETADPAGDGVANLAKYAFGGDPLRANPITGLPRAESGGGVTFYDKQLSALSYAVYESPDLVNWTLVWQSSDGFSSTAVAVYTPNVATGFDAVTIRDPSGGFSPIRFWQVKVTGTL